MPRGVLEGRVALVTGASSGLGDRFARVLDAAGASVVVTARRQCRLDSLATELTDPLVVAGDITHAAFREALVDATRDRYGRVLSPATHGSTGTSGQRGWRSGTFLELNGQTMHSRPAVSDVVDQMTRLTTRRLTWPEFAAWLRPRLRESPGRQPR